MSDEFMSTQEVMDYLQLARSTLYNYIAEGKLKVFKSKTGAKKSYFRRDQVEALRGFTEAENLVAGRMTKNDEAYYPEQEELAEIHAAIEASEEEKARGFSLSHDEITKRIADRIAAYRMKRDSRQRASA